MDKKADSLLPGKPSGSVTDPDVENDAKKPSLGISELPGIFTDGVSSEGLNIWTEATDETSKLAFPESHLMVSGASGEASPQRVTKLADKDDSHRRTSESRDGDLVQGSDGRMYRLLRGPRGLMGPPGEEVSPAFIFSRLSPILLFCFIDLSLFLFPFVAPLLIEYIQNTYW